MNGDEQRLWKENREDHKEILAKLDNLIDKSTVKWLIGGSFAFSMAILALVLRIHLGG